ncbi:acyl-CoA ligase (AMP-forming), exosortase A system-associated [Actinospica durhamensis]|uniref:Acyl-CoA ligase (AMP-forming), exosortase A system-associated n=1 Tax=Actinospica durhamensis TaxID=1508375 RepID=A0A941IPV2_9ACTN|nr:acyl-CoA ligase (AMP-forming), exosortase A system-associated [Actinospica durhamensis]MBR7833517.1 acyl-CoA ligase (AMP-forming), exosortase A system-associated [Actinospica durhamensis]
MPESKAEPKPESTPEPRVRVPAGPVVRIDQLVGRGDPDRPAVTVGAVTLTYRALAQQVAAAAHGLHALGVRRGDRVVVYAEKRPETVVSLLAVAAAGAVFVPVNPLYRQGQLSYVLRDCAPRAVVTTAERSRTVLAAFEQDAAVPVVLIGGSSPTATESENGLVPWAELVGGADAADAPSDPVPGADEVIDQDVAAIMYTSGSTGGPKGVVLSHRNLLAGAASVAAYLGNTPDDVVLGILPLSFDAGLSQLTTALNAGAHVVLADYLRPKDVVGLCARHGVTGLTGVPPLWLQLVEQDWPAEATERLRYFANTGGRMPRATLARLRRIFPAARPYLMYGLTEAFRSTYLDPAEVDRRPDSIGKAIPNAEVLVVRPDGTPCAPGEHGELVHRGALVGLGYWNDPVRTAERFRPLPRPDSGTGPETAVWSGDTVYRDADGFLYFVGRVDEMIKTSGYRVSPTEIEEAAYATGLASEAVALGVEDARLGQRVVLYVAMREVGTAPDALTRALAGTLPSYMLPQRVHVLDALPRSVNGKFDRVQLRAAVSNDDPSPTSVGRAWALREE